MWWLYEVLLVIGLLGYLPKALWRRRLPHRGWGMRLGRYPACVGETLRSRRPVWVHAVSVGEVLAAQPILQALAQGTGEPVVLSTITSGGFAVASKALNGRGVPVYFPLDLRACVARALDAIHPRLLLLVESEFWPTVIRLTKARGIPIAVVNGRISARAFRRYQWVRPWLSGLLRQVDLFLMQGREDADRVIRLGAPAARVKVMGSLKWDASLGARPAPAAVQETLTRLGLTGDEPVIVAGSTHRGEEGALLDAFRALRASFPRARLLIAPRHLERMSEVEGLIRQGGWASIRLSQAAGDVPWDVGLVDTFGEMPRYYGLATAVFIGGSLIPHGGQNPLEAASLGKPVVFGPSMQNFSDIAAQLLGAHAARQLAHAAELAPTFQELLAHPADAQAMGRRAQELTERCRGAGRRTLAALAPLLVLDTPSSTT